MDIKEIQKKLESYELKGEHYIERYFSSRTELEGLEYLNKALGYYESILKNKENYNNLSYVYVQLNFIKSHIFLINNARNWNKTEWEKNNIIFISDEQYKILLKDNDLAIKYREENESAQCQRAFAHFLRGEYNEFINQIKKIDHDYVSELLSQVINEDQIISIFNKIYSEGYYNKNLIRMFEKVLMLFPNNKYAYKVLSRIHFVGEDSNLLEAINFYEEIIELYPQHITIYASNLCLLYTQLYKFNKHDKLIDLSQRVLQEINNDEITLNKKSLEKIKDEYKMHLFNGLLLQGDYDKAYEVINTISKYNRKNNTFLHNMGNILIKIGKYEDAIIYLKKALFIYEDETSLMLLGDAYFEIKQYQLSYDYYTKALAFITLQKTNIVVKKGKRILTSLARSEDLLEGKKRLYEGIIHSLIQLKKYSQAEIYLDIAIKEFSIDDSFRKLRFIIETLVESDIDRKEKERLEKEIRLSLQVQIDKLEGKINTVKDWAVKLLDLQEDIDTENEWERFEKELISIADSMVSTNNSEYDINKIKLEINKEYKKLEFATKKFLYTANYLYLVHEVDMIDYAPIVIEYCKAIELEFNFIISKIAHKESKKHLNITWKIDKSYTLGEIKHKVKEITPLYKILEEVVEIRNNCAHSGLCNRETANRIREIIFKQGLLNDMIIMKKNKNIEHPYIVELI